MRQKPNSLLEVAIWTNEKRDRFDVLLDEFLDMFYFEINKTIRQEMIKDNPVSMNNERQDAYIGAVGEHLARKWDLKIPDWANDSSRNVSDPWFVGVMGVELSALLLVESPLAFRRRGIFTEAVPLRRASMPTN